MPTVPGREGFGTLAVLTTLARNRKILFGLPLLSALVGLLISFSLPEVYRSGIKILPPQQAQSGAAALLSQLGGAAGMAAGAVGVKNPADLYIGMLKSRTVADSLVRKFELNKIYGTESQEKARRMLEGNTFISAGKEGIITVEFESEDRKLVAPVANAYISELIGLTGKLAVTEAGQRRIFFERQLAITTENLAKAELSLKSRLDVSGVFSVDTNSRAILETAGKLKAQISAKEIEINSMAAFVTQQNPTFKRAQQELSSLKAELSRLENGRADNAAGHSERSGGEGLRNIRLLREVKYHQMLYELLAKQYEAARIDEAKDGPLIQVLDPAIEPERKSKPKRLLVTISFFVFGLLIALLLILAREFKARLLETDEGHRRWNDFRSEVRFK